MTTLSLPTQSSAYTLVEGLRDLASAPSVWRAAPNEWAREELLLRKLGAKGWGRVHHFRNYYSSGWGDKGRGLSPRAVDAFFRFVEQANFPVGVNPSVSLTDRGGIELCWEDHHGKSVQLEFTGSGVAFYKSADDEEGFVSFDALPQLSERFSG